MSCFLPTLPQTFITEWHTWQHPPPAPVVVFSKGNCLILKRYLKHWWVFLLSLWHRLLTAPSSNEVTQKHRELTPSWALVTQIADRILGCLGKSRSREVSLHPALCSALVRPHLEHWGSPYEPDVEYWHGSMKGYKDDGQERRLRELGLFKEKAQEGTWSMYINTW